MPNLMSFNLLVLNLRCEPSGELLSYAWFELNSFGLLISTDYALPAATNPKICRNIVGSVYYSVFPQTP